MSSSTFTQRWTSVNDLTTNSNNNNQLASFFLQSSSPSIPNTFTFTIRPSQSLVSLVEPSPSPPPLPPRPSEKPKPSASRVADIIHRFESHNVSSMNSNHSKVSPPTRSVFTKQWEENPPIESPANRTPLNFKKINRPQPIIVYERITNHDRPLKSASTPPPVSPKSPLVKTWLQNKAISQQNVESDTDSAIHTMAAVINTDTNDSATLSRSSTADSTSSSSSSSSVSPSTPHFALPTIASTQKQRDLTSNSTSFKRTCSPPPPTVTTFTRTISSTPSTRNEDLEPAHTSSLTTRFCSSEANLADQYRRLSSPDGTRSEINLSQKSATAALINPNLPLKYKIDSFIRLYG
jgi:hypothetical protein